MWTGVVARSCLLFYVLLHHHYIAVKRQVVLLFLSGSCNLSQHQKLLLTVFRKSHEGKKRFLAKKVYWSKEYMYIT